MKKGWSLLLRVLLSLVFLIIVLYQGPNLRNALGLIKGISYKLILLSIAFYFISYAIATWRWWILFPRDSKPSFCSLFRYNIIALFFNNILPTALGGDVYRVIKLGKYGLSSVFMERLIGFCAVSLLAVAGIFRIEDPIIFRRISIVFILFSLCLIAIILLVFVKPFAYRAIRFLRRIKWLNIGSRLSGFYLNIGAYRERKMDLFKVFLISILFQLAAVGVNATFGLGLGLDIPLDLYCTGVSLVAIVTALPSIGGIGFREGGYYLLVVVLAHHSKEAALALSTVIFAITLFGGFVGGILYLMKRD